MLANSQTLVRGAEMHGVRAGFVPSIVNLDSARTETSRERILLVNPRREHGVDVVGSLAASFPTIEFVLQESWPLRDEERAVVDDIVSQRPNVVFRSRTDNPSDIYRDAAILLAPHKLDNRPRTVLEALSNGIPVVCSDLPGLVESVGPAGICLLYTSPSPRDGATSRMPSSA